MWLPGRVECLSSQGRGEVLILKIACFLQIILDQMTGNVVISEVDALMYVVLSEAEKHVPYWGLVITTESSFSLYEGWNFNFGNTPLDWIQEPLE